MGQILFEDWSGLRYRCAGYGLTQSLDLIMIIAVHPPAIDGGVHYLAIKLSLDFFGDVLPVLTVKVVLSDSLRI